MAETQQVIIEFLTNTDQVDTAINKLEKTGAIDSKLANGFKQTTAEISKQAAEIQKTSAATAPLKKSLEDVAKVVKTTTSAFITGFHEGVQDSLKQAGVSISELKQKLGLFNKDSPFEKLGKSLSEARNRVLNITTAMAQLKRTGGVDTEQFKKLGVLLVQRQAELSKLQADYDEVTGSVARNKEATDENADAQQKLKQRLAEVSAQLVILKANGEDNTEQYKALVAEAGNIKDAIGDVNQEIKNSAANSQVLDGLIGSAQGVAAGFALAQGSVGLFGSENQDLNAVLVKVNSTMALLQGAQEIGNLLQKESAAVQLVTNARLAIENGLQSESAIVRLGAAAAQRVLNAAMAANPIGIIVVAVAGLITILATYGRSAAAARQQTSNLNVALGQGAKNFEERAGAIKQQGDAIINALENEGATSSRIAGQRIENEKQIADSRKQRIAELKQLEANSAQAELDKRQELQAEIRKLEDEAVTDQLNINNLTAQQQKILNGERLKNIVAGLEAELVSVKEGSQKQLNLQKQLIAAKTALELNADGLLENERAAIIAKGNQERVEAESAFNKRRIDLQLQGIEAQLVNVREGSQEELDLRKKQISLQVQSEITNTKLSEKEKAAIKEKGFQDQLKLQREFNERVRREAIEGQISLNEAQIAQIKTNDEDRLILQIANIELAAAAEVDAAKGNSAKMKEINAKRDADILAVRKKFIDDAAQYEIDIRAADNGPSNRLLQKTINDEKKSLDARKTAIRQLANEQIKDIDTRLKALQDEKDQRLISDKDYILKYKQLQDQKQQITEDSEKAITDATKAENIKRAQISITVLGQIGDVIQGINDTESQRENERLEAERQRVSELLEAGAITEEEAKRRNKRLDIEEKKVKAAQAKREKDMAIFRALLAIPQAFLNGLSQSGGNPYVAAIYAALAAAEAVVIAARPLPKFGKGKKDRYEGPAQVGETGPELYEQNGKMFLADKSQIVWLGASDKVYNPKETKEMLMPVVDKQLLNWRAPAQKAESIDYDKLGKAVGKYINIPGFNIDEEGFKIWEQQGQSRKNYMDKRYSSK